MQDERKNQQNQPQAPNASQSATATVRPWWMDWGKRKIEQNSYRYGVCIAAGALFLSDFIFDNSPAYLIASAVCFMAAKYFHSRIKSA